MESMKFVLIVLCFSLVRFHNSLAADDTISPNQTLLDNGQTLVSIGEKFELGFFSPQNSKNRYVGIWFKNVTDLIPVWVANRDNPLLDSSGALKITETGNIVIVGNQTENFIWSSNSSAEYPTLQLLDTGNLVVKDGSSENYAWQSFDHPRDLVIAGMTLGWDYVNGRSLNLTSWSSPEDPSTGNFTYALDPRLLPQVLLFEGRDILVRTGPYDGVRIGGDRPLKDYAVFRPNYNVNETHVYATFSDVDNSTANMFRLNPSSGSPELLRWNQGRGEWVTVYSVQKDDCDTYERCGPNGLCDSSQNRVCQCPTGFLPKVPEEWNRIDSSSGCVLKTSLNCSASEGFKKFSGLKLPYGEFSVNWTVVRNDECELICRRNCSCVAYAVALVGGCVVWSGDMLDMRLFTDGGQDLYIRMAASEFGSDGNGKRTAVIISMSVVAGFVVLFLLGWYTVRKRTSCRSSTGGDRDPVLVEEDVELPSFGFDTIAKATNNFSPTNKIGEGGFGPVYKGVLSTEQEIAVKRLSKDSGQGLVEFQNEVILIAKLQHRNLVRLLGCCIQGEERMLIYEYMPNRSLDLYIFNQTRGTALDWRKRFDIIVGIARGLLYLHRDSRLTIIHRDLKASNILLDHEMNPKISDFGLARIFRGDKTQVNTKRVVGTYGYMSPEYAIDGQFSVKSDVFSFGVMVLEILSGEKNRGFAHPDHELNLLGHAWKLWNEGRPMELVDILMENIGKSEVLRCIEVGLLCVQKRPEDRPSMSSVLSMLDNENISFSQPKQPGFYTERSFTETDSSSSLNMPNVSAEISFTKIQSR